MSSCCVAGHKVQLPSGILEVGGGWELPIGGKTSAINWRFFNGLSRVGLCGLGWLTTLDRVLFHDAGSNRVYITEDDGSQVEYTRQPDGSWLPMGGEYNTLARDPASGEWLETTPEETTNTYHPNGLLWKVAPPEGSGAAFQALQYQRPYGKRANNTCYPTLIGVNECQVRISYDTKHLVRELRDWTGRTVQFQYDDRFRLTAITGPDGCVTGFAYGAAGAASWLAGITDAEGNETTFQYIEADGPDRGRVAVVTRSGRITRYGYDRAAAVVTKTDPDGLVTEYRYKPETQRILEETENADGEDHVTQSEYGPGDTGFEATRVTDAEGRATNYEYDARGRLTAEVDALGGRSETSYTPTGLVASARDKRGNTEGYEYTPFPEARLKKVTDRLGNVTETQWSRNQAVVTDPRGLRLSYQRGIYRDLWSTVRDVATERRLLTHEYYPTLLPRSERDANRNVTTFQYNHRGLLTEKTDPLGQVERWAYDHLGRVSSHLAPDGVQADSLYDPFGNEVARTLTAGSEHLATQMAYDAGDRLTQVTDPAGRPLNYGYDGFGRQKLATNAVGGELATEYDRVGNPILRTVKRTNHDSITTETTYDALNRPVRIKDGLDREVALGYDANGNLTSLQRGGNPPLTSAYDAMDRLVGVTDERGQTVTVTRDANGNVTEVIEPRNSQTTRYAYERFNRLAQQTDPLGKQLWYDYDPAGNIIARRAGPAGQPSDPNQIVGYEYDALNRLTKKTYPDGSGVEYEWDAGDRLVRMQDALGEWRWEHDGFGRLVRETYPDGGTILREYDASGNVTKLTDPSGRTRQNVYDQANRMTKITDHLGKEIAITYDYADNPTQVEYPNGVAKTVEYDNANQVVEINYRHGGNPRLGIKYEYDEVGNRTQQKEGGLKKEYAYDASTQLTGERWHGGGGPALNQTIAYDEVGNRTQLTEDGAPPTSYTHNAGNELVETARGTETTTMAYDILGNLAEQHRGDDHWWFTSDAEGRIVEIRHRYLNEEGEEVERVGINRYDGLGRRIYQRDLTGEGTWFSYDGLELLTEKDDHGRFRASYIYGPGLVAGTGLLLAAYVGSEYRCYHQDALGTTRLITDGGGNLIKSYQTDAWGNIVQESGTIWNRIIFTGRCFDADTGLYYFHARYYDPRVGRFVQRELMNYAISLLSIYYTYVTNSPVNKTDPSGYLCRLSKDCADCIASATRGFLNEQMGCYNRYKTDPIRMAWCLTIVNELYKFALYVCIVDKCLYTI